MLDTFDTDQLNAISVSSYHNYPTNKPFINTEWTRPSQPSQPGTSKAFPESNRDEIISSLKKLQEKLFRLEMDQKSDNQQSNGYMRKFKNVNEETYNLNNNTDNLYAAYPINNIAHFSNSFLHDENFTNTNNTKLIYSNNNSINEPYLKHIVDIDEKAVNTEKRVLELEKQLEKMRKLIKDDSDSNQSVPNLSCKPSKKNLYNKSQASILTNEKKKPQIENPLIESDTTLHDVDQEFSHEDDTNNSDDQKTKTIQRSRKKILKNANKQTSAEGEVNRANKHSSLNRSKSADEKPIVQAKSHQHFKLNLGEIPFVVGKSTTPSHHLGTNIQNVFSLLKQHHPRLCGKFNSSCNSAHSNTSSTNRTTANKCRRSRCSVNMDQAAEETKPKRSKSTPMSSLVASHEKSSEQHQQQQNISSQVAIEKKTSKKELKSMSPVKMDSSISLDKDKEENLLHTVDWNELLRILQEEYTRLVLNHYDLTKKIINCADDNKRNEYEIKADYLHRKMKTKAKQINKLKAIQQNKRQSNKQKNSVEFQCPPNTDHTLVNTNQNKYSQLQTQLNLLTTISSSNSSNNTNNNNNNYNNTYNYSNSASLSHSIDKQASSSNSFNPKNLKLFKDIKNFQYRYQYE